MSYKYILWSVVLLGVLFSNKESVFKIDGMMCRNGCVYRVNSVINSIDGVEKTEVDFDKGIVVVNYNPEKTNDDSIILKLKTETTYSIKKEEKTSIKKNLFRSILNRIINSQCFIINIHQNIQSVSIGLVTQGNKILTYKVQDKISSDSFYRLIGGHIEFGEHAKNALKREFQEEINQEIKIDLRNGKIISKEQLDIEIKIQTPIFLETINAKRNEKNEPKVTNKQIISSAFVNLEKNNDVEIMYLCQIYTPVIRRLIDESRDKIKELTSWK